ncbi:MAG: bacillithiol biosynthesis deacetylase BshB1 [Theionarchaea archaeon]|nr:bacillithiol biosynthesis deacetylase BshB1 [Theionarchaea archaeon]
MNTPDEYLSQKKNKSKNNKGNNSRDNNSSLTEKENVDNHVDVLAFSPHPDDAELGCGGFLLEMKKKGYRTGIIDLTQGEMGSTASAETRLRESQKAATHLELDVRSNLNLGDCHLTDSYETRIKVAATLKKLTPSLVLAPFHKDRHPDHHACSLIVKHALVYARLKKLGNPHYITYLFYYLLNTPFTPTFIMDITASFNKKIEVLSLYTSQFSSEYPLLKEYIPHTTAKALYYGSLVNVQYGEPFQVEGFLKVNDPLNL